MNKMKNCTNNELKKIYLDFFIFSYFSFLLYMFKKDKSLMFVMVSLEIPLDEL